MSGKRRRKIRYDRVIGTLLVLIALSAGTVLLVRSCSGSDRIIEVTDLLIAPANDKGVKSEVGFTGSGGKSSSGSNENTARRAEAFGRIKINSHGHLRDLFNDSNYVQLEQAERLGIHPLESLNDAYFTRRPIVEVRSTRWYTVDSLTHSLPFLVPEAERLLSDIGRNFIDSLHNRGRKGYKVRATSLLRTPALVKKLRRVNVNATEVSTHQFGTTFDISYRRFDCPDSSNWVHEEDLKNLLAEVLYDLKAQGRCMVKFERKTGCFHITVSED